MYFMEGCTIPTLRGIPTMCAADSYLINLHSNTGNIPTLLRKVRIPTLHSAMLELRKFQLWTEHIHCWMFYFICVLSLSLSLSLSVFGGSDCI